MGERVTAAVVVEDFHLEAAAISAAAEVEAPSVTSVTGSVTSPGSVAKRRTAATSAMALDTLQGTAARMRTLAITVTRLVIL